MLLVTPIHADEKPARPSQPPLIVTSPSSVIIAANNGHVLVFDNLSGLPPWLSDTHCGLASGGSFAVLQLYTDQTSSCSTPPAR
jgi:hypothetical protein